MTIWLVVERVDGKWNPFRDTKEIFESESKAEYWKDTWNNFKRIKKYRVFEFKRVSKTTKEK